MNSSDALSLFLSIANIFFPIVLIHYYTHTTTSQLENITQRINKDSTFILKWQATEMDLES